MIAFGLSKEKDLEIATRLKTLNILESDIEEKFIRSSGPGGQNVNKVATCVSLRHPLSGIEVKCQQERSQALNRYFAYRMLLDKIEQKKKDEYKKIVAHQEKLKRQNRKRPDSLKEKILEKKRYQAEKKSLRSKIYIYKMNEE